MDPWLEHPGLWPDVHERLVIAIARHLGPILRPRYYVAVDIHFGQALTEIQTLYAGETMIFTWLPVFSINSR